jgi:hypothetical protein
VSRLCGRVMRRASPGLDTDLSGLSLSFIYPGNVRFSCNTLNTIPISSTLAFSTRQIHLSSFTGSARNPFGSGKPIGVRQTTAPVATRDLPITLRRKSRFTVVAAVPSTSLQNCSRRPPVSPQSLVRFENGSNNTI